MDLRSRELYRSPNGDRWHLVRVSVDDHVFVRHDSSQSSGGAVQDLDVGDFVVRAETAPRSRKVGIDEAAGYFQGFVLAVPDRNKDAYTKLAREAWQSAFQPNG